jgi:4-amino-4-deoxy-L-arabinose transferase-like glycosyltransferase
MVEHTRRKSFFTPQRLAILILLVHLVLGVLYSVAVPIWEAHDEWGHYAFVRYLATERALPPPGTKLVERYDESVQPPLYYVLSALTTFWINTDDELELTANPYATTGDGTGGVNFAVHRWEAEAFPYKGTVLAIHVTRLVSVLLSTLVVWTTYLIGRSLLPEREEIALGAMAINAFWPQFLFIGSVVNNDIMVTVFSCLVLLFLIRIAVHGTGFRDWLALGLCLAGAFASKRNALALFPLAFLCLMVPASRWLREKSASLRWAIVASLALGLVLAWLLFWNVILHLPYFRAYAKTLSQLYVFLDPCTIAERVNWHSLRDFSQYAFLTLWAVFGWGNIGIEEWIYDLVAFVCLLAGLGLLFFLSRKSRPQVRLGLVILMVDVVFVTAMPMYISLYQNKIFLMPGRYILPAISAVSVLLSVGLAGPIPRRAARTLMAAVTAVMFAFALLVPFRYILPAYAEPPILSQADLQAIQNPLGANFDNKAELLGYDVGKGRVRAGEAIAVTLYWRCLGRMERNYTLSIQVLGPDYHSYGGVNLYPGRGNFATSLWQVGDTFSESYWIPIASDAPAPGMGHIKVALFIDDSTQEHLPVFGPQGQIADHSAVFGRIKIVPKERPEHVIENQAHYELGGKLALIGYEMTSPIEQKAGLDLRLYWQALSEIDEDYTVFVHWLDEEGQIRTQQDNQPRNGTYPTGLWDEGEIVEDLYHLTVPAGLLTDQAPVLLAVGMYRLETLERLPVFDENGQRLAGDQIILKERVE